MPDHQHSEIVIMGGGVIGVACAYYFLKAGRQVRIIDRNKIGSGASHGNCGWACFSEIIPLCESGIISDTIKKKEAWVGLRPMSCDDMPIIDWSPVHKNLMFATGHSMLGITMAPATGKLVAEMMTGETPFMDPAVFSVKRFQ